MTDQRLDLLSVDDLEVRYDNVCALAGVCLRVGRGEIVALFGPNGAGKSTLLMTVAGLLRPSRGEVRFEGHPTGGMAVERLARSGVALVPEGRRIFTRLTVEENLRAAVADGRTARRERLRTIYELFPILFEYRSRLAGYLSGGQQQQLAISRALLCRPTLLLLDEPSLGLAPTIAQSVFSVLKPLQEAGVSVLLVEQRIDQALGLADRSYVLSGGHIRLEVQRGLPDLADRVRDAYFVGGARPDGDR